MWQNNLPLRVTGPTVLVSVLLMGLCASASLYLYSQQASSADVLGENVSSAQVAHDLENTLHDLAVILQAPQAVTSAGIEPLNQRMEIQLGDAKRLADKEEEKRLVDQLDATLQGYLDCWKPGHQAPTGQEVRTEALALLQQALPSCSRLEQFNSEQTTQSEGTHRRMVQWMAVGLIGLGTLGSIAGIFLGHAVARGLRQSIYQLSVRVRDAAGMLGQEIPPVVVSENGDLHHLNRQVQGLVREIEQVVERLQQREREVLRAEQLAAVGQLAAGLAHELRNPLTSIKILVQSIREEAGGQRPPGDDLQIIEVEIRRMEKCLQTFLDFARPPRPEFRAIDLSSLVDRTFALIGIRARKQHVNLKFHRPEKPPIAEVDSAQLQQVLVNLGLNSLDAMPRGGSIEVDIRKVNPGMVEIRFSDTGPGIAAEIVPRLFQPFVSGKETGLGLGLVISRRIAENHGGELFAVHRPQEGACFVLRLPTHAPTAVPAEKVLGQESPCPSC